MQWYHINVKQNGDNHYTLFLQWGNNYITVNELKSNTQTLLYNKVSFHKYKKEKEKRNRISTDRCKAIPSI